MKAVLNQIKCLIKSYNIRQSSISRNKEQKTESCIMYMEPGIINPVILSHWLGVNQETRTEWKPHLFFIVIFLMSVCNLLTHDVKSSGLFFASSHSWASLDTTSNLKATMTLQKICLNEEIHQIIATNSSFDKLIDKFKPTKKVWDSTEPTLSA